MKYIVMNGSPFDGMIVNGPFATAEDASEWAEALTADWWVGELEPVEPACDCLCHGPNAGLRGHHHTGCKCLDDYNLRLGKALDDLGDANVEIRALKEETTRLLSNLRDQKTKVAQVLDFLYKRNTQIKSLEADLASSNERVAFLEGLLAQAIRWIDTIRESAMLGSE